MKRVLVAGVLGGLLLLGTPTLASSAEKERHRTERKHGAHKGDHDRDHKGDRDHWRDGDRHRHGHRHYRHHYGHRQYYGGGYYGGYYGHPYYGDPYWSGYSGGPRRGQVIVQGMAFHPAEVHAPAGAPVLWLFQDGGVPHTVTADNGSFDSGRRVNDEFRLRFDQPGTYSYHCALHPEMKGRVIVHG